MSRRDVVVWGVVAVVVAVVGTVWYGAKLALEHSHYVVLRYEALDALTEYVERNGTWPASWDELRTIPIRSEFEYDVLEEKLHIDFDRRLEEIAAMTPGEFDVVRNQGDPYPLDPEEWRVIRLIGVAREAVDSHEVDSPTP